MPWTELGCHASLVYGRTRITMRRIERLSQVVFYEHVTAQGFPVAADPKAAPDQIRCRIGYGSCLDGATRGDLLTQTVYFRMQGVDMPRSSVPGRREAFRSCRICVFSAFLFAFVVCGPGGAVGGQSLGTYQARLAFRPPAPPSELAVVRYSVDHPLCDSFKSFSVEDGAGLAVPCRVAWRSGKTVFLVVYTGLAASRGSELYVYGHDQAERVVASPVWTNDLMKVGVTVRQRGSPTLPNAWDRFLYFWEKSSSAMATGVGQDMDLDDFPAMMVRLSEQNPSPSPTNAPHRARGRRPVNDARKAEWRAKNGRPAVLVRLESQVLFPSDGDYRMALECQDSGYVLIDGVLVLGVESGAVPGGWQVGEARRYMAGLHTVEVMTASVEPVVRVGWAPPGSAGVVQLGGEALIAPGPVLDGRFEVRGRFVHANFSHTVLDPFRFRDVRGMFVPVRFTDTSRNPGGASLLRRWGVEGRVESAASMVHTFPDAGEYRVRLDVEDGLGATGACERVVDVRPRIAQEYAVDFEVGGLPAACFSGDHLSPYLVASGQGPSGVAFKLSWSFYGPGTNLVSGGETNVALAGAAVKVDMGKHTAGDLRSLAWGVSVAGREIKGGNVTFAMPPFAVWPESVVADRMCDRAGGRTVLVTTLERTDDSYDQCEPLPRAGPVVLLDDTLVPYAHPGGGRETYSAILPRMLDGSREVRYSSLAPPEESGGSLKSLLKFVLLAKAAGEGGDRTVVLSCGIHDMLLGLDDDSFERGLAAMADKLVAGGASVVLVTPPPYPGMEARLRKWAVAVRRVADARLLPVVDLYTAFIGLRGAGGPFFEVDTLGLAARGHKLAAERIATVIRNAAGN